jgi:hypothetical protein
MSNRVIKVDFKKKKYKSLKKRILDWNSIKFCSIGLILFVTALSYLFYVVWFVKSLLK